LIITIFTITSLLKINLSLDTSLTYIYSLFIGAGILVNYFLMFAYQSRIIGQQKIIQSLKESVNLVWNHKIKALILIVSLMPTYLIKFIPTIGFILGDIITPILTAYLIIIITQLYIDLTQ
jgi:hypothetical protein